MSKSRKRLLLWGVLVVLAGLVGGSIWLFADLPNPSEVEGRFFAPSVRITDRHGRLLYEVLPGTGGRHTVIPLRQMPKTLREATIATEDRTFYANPGVDPVGIARAVWQNLRGGDTRSGASTITQQVARNLLLTEAERGERSLRRKLREAFLAWRLTLRYSKDDILAFYLNQIYYGGMAYGVEAAAQTFFGKPASELDLAESALIAGLPQSPAAYNPYTDLEAAQARQRTVLRLMQDMGAITTEQRTLAEREPLVLASAPYPLQAPHFVMMVQRQIDGLFSQEAVYEHGGLVVRTTLDLDWQQAAERAIERQIEDLRRSEDGLGHNLNNAALVAIDPQSGEILALVGSPDYFDESTAGAVNMATSARQPGSALKPLIYALAMDPARPEPWTAASMLLDVRTSFVTKEGEAYVPVNYDFREHGPVLVREALASSLNIPAVKALDHVGLPAVFEFANRLGISSLQNPENYDLSLALGGGEVSLLELTNAYAAFANGGFRLHPFGLLEVTDLEGEVLYAAPATRKERVLDERVAWLISDILSDNDARTLGFGPNSILRLDRPAAVKTGTTSNWHDNWTIGYTPDLVVGVWAGNTSYEPMRDVNGLAGAAPVWHQFVRDVLTGMPKSDFTRPPGLVQVDVCNLSGLLPTADCPYRRLEWFLAGTEPQAADTCYRRVKLDRQTGRLADGNTPPERIATQVALDLPPLAHPWARQQGLLLLSDLQAGVEGDGAVGSPTAGQGAQPLALLSPAGHSVFFIAPNFQPEAQRLRLEAAAEAGLRQVIIYVDGNALGAFDRSPYVAWWPLAEGEHRAWAEAVRADGATVRSDTVVFTVKH